jgi:cyclase
MLKKRLIPKLLIKDQVIGGRQRDVLVTTAAFSKCKVVGDVVSQAKIYEAQMADELIVLNINGTNVHQNERLLDLIESLATQTYMPLCVGGGVKHLSDFEDLLKRGADKVSINTAALTKPEIISAAANRYGSQCVVVSIDFKMDSDGRSNRVVHSCGRLSTDHDVLSWAKEAYKRGAGEILLCDVGRDGSGRGLNISIARNVVDELPIPVIISGGCGRAEHFVEGFVHGKVDAVAAGTFFALRDQSPLQTRAHIANAGISIRMNV